MMKAITRWLRGDGTPQTVPLPGQTQNHAGGFAWGVDMWAQLDRFLVLGSEGGTFYVRESASTLDNVNSARRCIADDGQRVVRRVVEFSTSGRAPKNAPLILVLGLALKTGDVETRQAARAAVQKVCRTGTHLFQLAHVVEMLGGWGRGTRAAFANWYTDKDASEVAFQAVKYQRREGFSGRDVLRLAHPRPPTPQHNAVFQWMTKGWDAVPETSPEPALDRIWAFESAKRAESTTQVVDLIDRFRLPREAVPTQFLSKAEVWQALLTAGNGMPFTALLRNLGKLGSVGLLVPGGAAVQTVVQRLSDAQRLRRARVHPLAVLIALTTYRRGCGVRGGNTWPVVPQVVDALDAAFYASFQNVEATGKRWLLGLDVSGSMSMGDIAGLPGITPRVASAAMAMVTARTESQWSVMGFTGKLVPLAISPRQRLDDVVRTVSGLPFGRTDCAQPMRYALANRIPVDVFVIYTDNETWCGDVHPSVALSNYRQRMGIDAKLVVVGMTATNVTIADPNDPGMLDVVGFDAAVPRLMRDFVA